MSARRRMIAGHICDGLFHALWIWLIAMPLLAWLIPDHAMIVGALVAAPLALFTTRLRVTPQQAASELDRLNNAQDLISTAFSTSTTEPWGQTIHAMAARVCSGPVLPSATGKYAPRLHVATLLLVTAGALAIHTWLSTSASTQAMANIAEWRDGEAFEPANTGQQTNPSETRGFTNKEPATTDRGGSERRSQSGANARGDGRSDEGARTRIADRSNSTESSSTGDSIPSSGSGIAGKGNAGNQTQGTVQDPSKRPAIPPWQSPDWPARRAAALEAARQSDLPESDRALIREYFDQ